MPTSRVEGSLINDSNAASSDERFTTLVRSVGQGIREVHGPAAWVDVQQRAEELWQIYVAATGLSWSDVAERVYRAWYEAGSEGY